MKIKQLSTYLEKLENTSSRNEMMKILSELFKKVATEEIDKVCYLSLGELAPNYKGIDFGLAEKMVLRVLALAYQVTSEEVKSFYKKVGDLGEVAQRLAEKNPGKGDISINKVYGDLYQIAQESGSGSQEKKVTLMAQLFSKLDPLSSRFVSRIPWGGLQLGFSDATILDALSFMAAGDKSLRPKLERAYNVVADIGLIAKEFKEKGNKVFGGIRVRPGTPIRNSLAERLPSVAKIFEKVGSRVAIEPKMDGFRVQIHVFGKNEVRIFSRNLENTTSMFPDLVAGIKSLKTKDCVLDGEAIGYDPKTGKFTPFQETVQRKRKHGIEEKIKELPLKVFVFDVLYLNGRSYMEEPLTKRREVLEKFFLEKNGDVVLTPQNVVESEDDFVSFFKKSVSEGLEGVMAKKLDAPYQAGARGFHWIKYKPMTDALTKLRLGGEFESLADTVDCVVMGYFLGRGKRTPFGAGGFLAGVYDPKKEKFYTLTKVGTGLSDEDFRELAIRGEKLKVLEKPKEYEVNKNLTPDVWMRPRVVVELIADEITKSPIHTAGNLALRFPRLVKFRDDKNPEDATTVKEVENLYKMAHKK